jgi:xanthine dehydrogenase accessory factor
MLVLIRGGGDIASGVAVRLHRAGFQVLITELPTPMVVRRSVSFAEAVPLGVVQVEGISGRLIKDISEVKGIFQNSQISVLVDPDLTCREELNPRVIVDARMVKKPPKEGKEQASLVVGLGPGFTAGKNCHAVVETNRGHNLGRVIWEGSAEPDTGIPGEVGGYRSERVLRAPESGILRTSSNIGDWFTKGDEVCAVNEAKILASFDSMLRGLLRDGTEVEEGTKVGDLDPRNDPMLCSRVSDKSRAIGGGVLEAILACPDLRSALWIS